ncbi:hypothetical protein [Emticicia fontis]
MQYAYLKYAADIPHASIIQDLIAKGATPSEAQHILDIATIKYCTKSVQASSQPQPAQEEEISFFGVLKFIVGMISLIASVAQCMN